MDKVQDMSQLLKDAEMLVSVLQSDRESSRKEREAKDTQLNQAKQELEQAKQLAESQKQEKEKIREDFERAKLESQEKKEGEVVCDERHESEEPEDNKNLLPDEVRLRFDSTSDSNLPNNSNNRCSLCCTKKSIQGPTIARTFVM